MKTTKLTNLTLALVTLLFAGVPATSAATETTVPLMAISEVESEFIDDALAFLRFDPREKANLENGKVLFTGMPSQEILPQQLTVAGAMLLVRRPMNEVADAYLNELAYSNRTDVLTYQQLPATAGDPSAIDTAFEAVRFSAEEGEEVKKLLRVKPGKAFNLSLDEIAQFRAIDHRDKKAEAQATAVLQQILRERYLSFLKTGHRGTQAYARSRNEERSPGEELAVAKKGAWLLEKHFPAFHQALLGYPETTEEAVEHRFYWVKETIDKRPGFVLSHQLFAFSDQIVFMADERFYVGHSYNSLLNLVGAVPYRDGTLVMGAVRVFTDKVTGSMKGLKHTIGQKRVEKTMASRFEELRTALEQKTQPQ